MTPLALVTGTVRHVFLVATFISIGGCILLVPSFEPQDHCEIKGETACAECIRTSCQDSIDTCCGSSTCKREGTSFANGKDILSSVDACGAGDANECASNLRNVRSGEEEAVRSCVATKCSKDCLKGATGGGPAWSCATPRDAENECAQCIYTSCKKGLDECCGSSCGESTSLQEDMGACVAGDEPGCAWLLTKSTSGVEGVVRKCIVDSCGSKCMGDGRPHAQCTLLSGGAYCECSNKEHSGGDECSTEKVGGRCVIGKKGCTCGTFSCSAGSINCTCGFGDGRGDKIACLPSTEGDSPSKCCVTLSDTSAECECGKYTSQCYEGEYEVFSCSEQNVLNLLGGLVTDRCSR